MAPITPTPPTSSSPTPATPERVNHPAHYGGDTTYEAIKVIEAWRLDQDFCLGNAVKYLCRAGKKDNADQLEDLRKAHWYLQRRIDRLLEATPAPAPPITEPCRHFTNYDPLQTISDWFHKAWTICVGHVNYQKSVWAAAQAQLQTVIADERRKATEANHDPK